MKLEWEPRQYQSESLDSTWTYLCREKGNIVLVLPTGSGKSWVIALLIQRARTYNGRVIVLAHRKELLTQNYEKIQSLIDDDIGIYSAGLNSRDTEQDVLVAGIQSVYHRGDQIGKRDLIIVDEAHLISPLCQTMYQQFIASLREVNPGVRMVGLTATAYRTGEGPIAGPDRIFRKVAYEVAIEGLVRDKYLSPLTFDASTTNVDTSKLKIRAGEFIAGDMERLFGTKQVVERACLEIAVLTQDRKSILVFCSGVSHAEYVREQLEKITGETVACVTGGTLALERMESLRRFKSGEVRIMVNCDVLTTGFDSPRIDCCAILRATLSPGLFAQMVGRGFRVHPDKKDCLILDFGGNRKRHGDPNKAEYGRCAESVDGVSNPQKAAVEKNGRGRICLNCDGDIPAAQFRCLDCGYVIPMRVRHESEADVADEEIDEIEEWWEVEETLVARWVKRGADPDHPPTLRVDYSIRQSGVPGNLVGSSVAEWLCFEHTGFARSKAVKWWRERSHHLIPNTVDEAIDLINRHAIRQPTRIQTKQEGKYRRIIFAEFTDPKPEVEDLQTVEAASQADPFSLSSVNDEHVPF